MRRAVADRRTGERDAEFAAFMAVGTQRLHRVAYLLTQDPGQAEELTQHALVRTYAAWGRLDGGDPYRYARRILVNLHSDWWRRHRRRERPVSQMPERIAGGSDPADTVPARAGLMRALARLSRRERAVIVLRYFLDLTEQQAAEELGVALGTVKSTTSRALQKLRVDPQLSQQEQRQGAS